MESKEQYLQNLKNFLQNEPEKAKAIMEEIQSMEFEGPTVDEFLSSMKPKIAITGNMGSGKSTIAKKFEKLGVPVYYSDDRSKLFLQEKNVQLQIRDIVKNINGYDLISTPDFISNIQFNMDSFKEMFFDNPLIKKQVTAFLHPLVRADYNKWHREQTHPFTMFESAILFEAGSFKLFDCIIYVNASKRTCVKRVIERNGWDEKEYDKRMADQLDSDLKIRASDVIINNHDGENEEMQDDYIVHLNDLFNKDFKYWPILALKR